MAKQRIQVGPLADPVPLTPRAAPVDTFHRPDVTPPNEGPSQMAQLSEALAQFNPHLQALGVDLHREQAANANVAGAEQVRKDARLQNRKGFNEAIKAGLIPEAKSPYFLKGMQEQLGRIESDRFDVALREYYSQSESQHQPDVTDFIGGFTSTYLKNHDLEGGAPEFQAVFQNNISNSIAHLQDQHTQRWQAEQSSIARDRLYQEVSFAAGSVGVYRSPEDQARDITARVNTLVTNGMSGTEANQKTIDAVTDKAIENGDHALLDLLKGVDTGNGPLANTQYGKAKIAEASDKIDSYLDHAANRDRQTAKQVKEEESTKIESFVQDRLRNDPWDKSPELEGALTRLNRVDPDKYRTITDFIDKSRKQDGEDVNENTDAAHLLRTRVATGEANSKELMAAVNQGVLKPSSFAGLTESLARAQTLRGPLNNASLKAQYDRLGAILKGGSGAYTSTGAAIVTGEHQSLLLATMAHMEKAGKDPYEIYQRAETMINDFTTNIVPKYMLPDEPKPKADGTPSKSTAERLPMFLSLDELNAAGKQAATGSGPLYDAATAGKVPVAKLYADELAKLNNLK